MAVLSVFSQKKGLGPLGVNLKTQDKRGNNSDTLIRQVYYAWIA